MNKKSFENQCSIEEQNVTMQEQSVNGSIMDGAEAVELLYMDDDDSDLDPFDMSDEYELDADDFFAMCDVEEDACDEDYYDDYDPYDDYDTCDSCGYEWTEEDSWDAMTDGMYGDMPSDPMAYDAMMDALGY